MNDRPAISLDQLVQSFSKPELTLPEPRSYASPSYGPRVDEPQKTIEIRNPRLGEGAGYSHPFKISVRTEGSPEELRLYVNAGRATAIQWQSGESFPNFREVGVSFGAGGDLENDEWGSYASVGYEVMSVPLVTTPYGVWVVFTVSGSSVANPSLSPEFPDIATTLVSAAGTILVTEDYPDPDDASALAVFLDSGSSPVYLGRVTIDGDGVSTVSQYRRSDIILPMTTLPSGLVWVGTNDIYIGTGGGLVVDP